MNHIFDSHAHYDDRSFDKDREEILSGLLENGVDKVMNISARLDEIKDIIELVNRYDHMWMTTGVHPTETYELKKDDIKYIEKTISEPKVKAIGEIGLDYHYDDTDKVCQREWFEAQLELAHNYKMPIVVHSRDAAQDTYDILRAMKAEDLGGVIHCFSYEIEMAKRFMDLGYYIGVGGVLTFKNARKLKEIVEYMPMELLLLETDCPYLAPVPFRGKRNDSTLIRYVVDEVSALKRLDADEVRRITNENACKLYNIDR